jgi:hypothetical protein
MKRVRRLPAEWLLLGAGWFAASAAVALFAGKARDWFDMTDELRYERLAESIAALTHSCRASTASLSRAGRSCIRR